MVIAFANNQAMTAVQGSASQIYTDPVPMNGMDRATAHFSIHYLWQEGSNSSIAYQAQVSNDGTNWVNVSALAETATSVTSGTPLAKAGIASYGAFIRFSFTLTSNGSSGNLAGVAFDLHVQLDKS